MSEYFSDGWRVKSLHWEESLDRKAAKVMGLTYTVGANLDGTFFSYCDCNHGEILAQGVLMEEAINAAEQRHRTWMMAWVEPSPIPKPATP